MGNGKALVTGGAGFIGSNIVATLLDAGRAVRVLDNLSTGRRENLAPFGDDVELLEADLRDPDACKRACDGVEAVFHQAALPSVPRSVADPVTTFEINVVGTHHLLLAARAAGVRRLVLASSSSVYGNQPTLPKHEQMPPAPASPYAAHKLSGEQLGMAFSRSLGLEVAALRYFNVYGPGQSPDSGYAAVIPAFTTRLLRGEAPSIHGDGEQTRDFTFISDVVRANLLASEAPGADGAFMNVAGGQRISINAIYAELAKLTGHPEIKAIHGPARAGDVRDSLASVDHAKACMDWTPQVDLATGLQRTVASYREALGV